MIGRKLSHFRILERIGEGGMGVVYKAEDVKLERPVALKVLRGEFVGNERRRERFLREAQAAAKVSHPHLAVIHEVGEADGATFIAMEYLAGVTLRAKIGGAPLAVETALRIALQIAEGLAAAHRSQVIHRDLKPENVMIDEEGRAKILDFGLAKLLERRGAYTDDGEDRASRDPSDEETVSGVLTQEGRILGTVAYMSPEQARGRSVDARSDVFSFGITLYEMLTGRAPFSGESPTDTLAMILREDPTPLIELNPMVSPELTHLVERCLEKDPERRFPDASFLVREIRRLLDLSTASDELPSALSGGGSLGRSLGRLLDARGPRAAARWIVPSLAVALLLLFVSRSANHGVPEPPAVPLENSLAVMSFQNLEDPGDPERLGQILQELIITDLSELGSLRVFSSQRLYDIQKQMGSDARMFDREAASKIAAALGAHRLLEGAISELGGTWILTAQLIDVGTGTVLRSQRIDGSDLYAMVDQLTERLRGDLELAMASGEKVESVSVREKTTSSLEAYRLYLAGVDLLNAGLHQAAADTLAQSIALDPTFGQAYYKQAMALWWAGSPGEEAEGKALAPLRRLLEEDLDVPHEQRLMAEAALQLIEQNWSTSETLYRKIVELVPDDKDAWYGLGEAIYHGGRALEDEALEAFERTISLDPSFTLAYRHIFDIYGLLGKLDQALARARQFIELNPENAIGYRWLAVCTVYGGESSKIEEALRTAREKHKTPPELQKLLVECAGAYLQNEDLRNARELFREAYNLDRTSFDGALYRGYSETLLALQDLKALEELREEMTRLHSARTEEIERIGFSLLLARHDYPGAIEKAKVAIETSPKKTRGYAQLVEALVRAERWGELERARTRALSSSLSQEDKAQFLAGGGHDLFQQGKLEEALSWTEESMKLGAAPRNAGRLQRGLVLTRLGGYEEAEAILAEMQEFSLERNVLRLALDVSRKRFVEAEATARKMLETGPRPAITYRMLATSLLAQERYADALPYARRAAEMTDEQSAWADVAWALVAGEIDLKEGVAIAKRAQARILLPSERPWIFPESASAEHCLGLAELKKGNPAGALALLEEAAKRRPDRPRIQEDLRVAKSLL